MKHCRSCLIYYMEYPTSKLNFHGFHKIAPIAPDGPASADREKLSQKNLGARRPEMHQIRVGSFSQGPFSPPARRRGKAGRALNLNSNVKETHQVH